MLAVTDPVGTGQQAAGFVRGALRSKSRSWFVRVGRAVLILGFVLPLVLMLIDRLR
jgi:hypothetical protein